MNSTPLSYSEPEYLLIMSHYGDRVARRSQVPLMNHINEGLAILQAIGGSYMAQRAFCIHPIVQNNVPIKVAELDSYSLAEKYTRFANSFLAGDPGKKWIRSPHQLHANFGNQDMGIDCAKMLYADKVQNRKDFTFYHKGNHENSERLEEYFDIWIRYLAHYQHALDRIVY